MKMQVLLHFNRDLQVRKTKGKKSVLTHTRSSELCRLWMQRRFPFAWKESTGAMGSCRVCV